MPDESVTLDPTAVTYSAGIFELVPVIGDILRTQHCVFGSIFLVEGLERVPVSRSGRWQVVRLLLGDGVLCIQALLGPKMHRLVQAGEVALGAYIRCEAFHARWQNTEDRITVALVIEDLTTLGWNESYRALGQPYPATFEQPPQESRDLQTQAPKATAKFRSLKIVGFDFGNNEEAAEEASEAFETLASPTKPKPKQKQKRKQKQKQKQKQQLIALPRDWHDPQTPLKLTTLRSIPHLPYKQNWSCNVLAIIASLSDVEPANLPPHRQRTARLADPSTSKQVHLTVFLDPEEFNPRIGSAVLLVGVKNHRFDGGSLKKYDSDRKNGRWWFEDPSELGWCDVEGIKAWWSGVTEAT